MPTNINFQETLNEFKDAIKKVTKDSQLYNEKIHDLELSMIGKTIEEQKELMKEFQNWRDNQK